MADETKFKDEKDAGAKMPPVKKNTFVEVAKSHRTVCSTEGLQVLDLGRRSVTFKHMHPVEITSAEYNHPNFQSRIKNFKEVK